MKVEPSADHRSVAMYLRQMYVALIDAGFTEREAINIIGAWWLGLFKSTQAEDTSD